jgi:Glycosyl hydrolase family 26
MRGLISSVVIFLLVCSVGHTKSINNGGVGGQGLPLDLQVPAIATYQAQATPSSFAAFTTFLGRPPQYALDYLSNGPEVTWADWLGSCNFVAGGYASTSYRLVLGLPSTAGATLAQIGAGNFDTYLAQCAQYLIANGEGNAIIRSFWEFNGGYYNWSPNGQPGFSATDFINAWIDIRTVFMAQPGANFQWFWCPAAGYGVGPTPNYYPGDAYVDYIGVDAYWSVYDSANLTQAQIWTNEYLGYYPTFVNHARQYAVLWAANFASQHSKPFAIGELGVGYEPSGYGAGDSNYFWDQLIPFGQTWNLAFIGIWTLGLPSGYLGVPWYASNYTGVYPPVTNSYGAGWALDLVHSARSICYYFCASTQTNLSTSAYETSGPSGLSFAAASGYSDGSGGLYIPTGTPLNTVLGQLSASAGTRIFWTAEQSGDGGTDTLVGVNQNTGQLTLVRAVSYENLADGKFSARNALNGVLINVNVSAQGTAPVTPATETLNANYQPANGTLLWTVPVTNTPSPAPTFTLTGTNAADFAISSSGGAITTNNQAALVNGTYTFNAVATNAPGSSTTAVTVVVHASGQTAPSNNQSVPVVTGPTSPIENFLASSNVYTGGAVNWTFAGTTAVSGNILATQQTYSTHVARQLSQDPVVSGNSYQLEAAFAAGGGAGAPQQFGLLMDSTLFDGACANFAFNPSTVIDYNCNEDSQVNANLNFASVAAGTNLARITATATGSGTATSTICENESFIPSCTGLWTAVANLQTALTNSGFTQLGLYGAGYENSTAGVWVGGAPYNPSYQWQTQASCTGGWSNLGGATALAYAVQNSDIGNCLRIEVTSTGTDSTTATAISTSTSAVVGWVPQFETLPTFTGTLAVGQVLTEVDGTYREAPTGSDACQWTRNGTNISGATSCTYTLQSADTSTLVAVAVTRTNSAGSATAASLGVGIPPTISAISSGTPGASTATITWTTNEAASSKVNYGLTTSYGSVVSNATLVTSHSLGLSGLTGGTIYHYDVVSTDANGYTATSADQTFVTTYQGPGDIQAFTSWWGWVPYNAAQASSGATTTAVADIYGATTTTYCTVYLNGDGSSNVDFTTSGAGGVGHPCVGGATTFCTVSNSGCVVAKMYDEVGTNPVVQATTTLMPTLVISPVPYIQSTASTSSALVCSSSVTPATGKVSFTLVANRTSGTVSEYILTENSNAGGANYILGAGANTWEMLGNSGNISTTAADATWHSAQGVINAASSSFKIDTATGVTGSITGGTTANKCAIARGGTSMTMAFQQGGYVDNVAFTSGVISSLTAAEQAVLP